MIKNFRLNYQDFNNELLKKFSDVKGLTSVAAFMGTVPALIELVNYFKSNFPNKTKVYCDSTASFDLLMVYNLLLKDGVDICELSQVEDLSRIKASETLLVIQSRDEPLFGIENPRFTEIYDYCVKQRIFNVGVLYDDRSLSSSELSRYDVRLLIQSCRRCVGLMGKRTKYKTGLFYYFDWSDEIHFLDDRWLGFDRGEEMSQQEAGYNSFLAELSSSSIQFANYVNEDVLSNEFKELLFFESIDSASLVHFLNHKDENFQGAISLSLSFWHKENQLRYLKSALKFDELEESAFFDKLRGGLVIDKRYMREQDYSHLMSSINEIINLQSGK